MYLDFFFLYILSYEKVRIQNVDKLIYILFPLVKTIKGKVGKNEAV